MFFFRRAVPNNQSIIQILMNGWYLILFWRLILQMPAATLRIFWLKVKIEFRGLVSTWYFLFLRPTYYKPGQMEILWKWKKIYALCHKFVTFGLHIILSVTVMKINCSLNLKTLSSPSTPVTCFVYAGLDLL